jgi:drug/metabolite transporter (DMT)-like permease
MRAAAPPTGTRPAPWTLPAAIAMTVLLWGSTFPAIRVALHSFPPPELALLRYAGATLLLGVLALVVRPPRLSLVDLPQAAACGLLGIAGYNLAVNAGQREVQAGIGSFLTNAAPLVTALVAVLRGERMRALAWGGAASSAIGIMVVVLGEHTPGTSFAGYAWLLGAAVLWASYSMLQHGLSRRYGAIGAVFPACCIGTACLLPWGPSAIHAVARARGLDLLMVAYLVALPTVAGFLAWSYALTRLPVSRLMPWLYAIPIIALVIGWLLLGERPAPIALVGCGLLLGGLILVQMRQPALAAAEAEAS